MNIIKKIGDKLNKVYEPIGNSLANKTDVIWNYINGNKTDEQIDLERELIEAQLEDSYALIAEAKINSNVDADDLKAAKKFVKRHDNCIAQALREKPNRHLGKDIFSHPFTGCYEHKDENGNWVEGPALGHGSEPGYDWRDSVSFLKEWCHKNFPD